MLSRQESVARAAVLEKLRIIYLAFTDMSGSLPEALLPLGTLFPLQ
jgi:hypothetical protein